MLLRRAYRKFCQRYRPQAKPEKKYHWGSSFLSKLKPNKRGGKQLSPGQMKLWDEWDAAWDEIHEIAGKFILANCYDPKFARIPSLATLANEIMG